MSLLGRFRSGGGNTERRTLTSSSFVPPPAIGVIDDFVGVHRSMAHMTVFACVRLLADTIASLPWKVYRRDSHGVPKEVKPQPAIIRTPYPGFDLFDWKWMTVASMALRGNSYGLVTSRDKQGTPTAILPLHPDVVFLERRPDLLMWFEPIYRILGEAAPREDIVHMRRFTMPGEPWGLSPIKQAGVAISMGLAAEEYGLRYFKESANPSGLLSTEQTDLDDEAIRRLQMRWIQSHGGRRLPAILTGGFKFQALSITPEESQFLECLTIGTKVTLSDGGRKPVEELCVGDAVMAWDGSKLVSAQVKAVGKPPIKEIVKVTTARGRELVCTADHPILGLKRLRSLGGRPLNTDGEWIPAAELEPGHYVRIGLGALPSEAEDLSEDIAYFLGAMVGDGYIRTGCCAWASGDQAVTDHMRQAVESLGGRLHYKDRCDYEIHTGGLGRGGSAIRGILNESGLVGCHSHEKFVPEMILSGGWGAWRAFLSAYFDADGSIRAKGGKQNAAAYWSSTSFELLEGCQHLLALLGINSAIYPMEPSGRKIINGRESVARQGWGLYVMGQSEMCKLANVLQPAHTEKRRRLLEYRADGPSRYRSVIFDYDSVKKVEFLGPGESIGVEIEGLHTFVTNGIISHNTRQFQRSEICVMYGVPPILIGDSKQTTAWGTGIAQINQGAIAYTFRPWTSRIESAISGLLPGGQFVRFDYGALLRGDIEGRYAADKNAIQGTIKTPNEVRADWEMDPVDGGDHLLVPPGFLPLGFPPAAGTPTKSPATPGSGTLPMPPVGGGENHRAREQIGIDAYFGAIEREMRSASRGNGKHSETVNAEEDR